MATDNPMSKLESAAILKLRGEFVGEIQDALTPIFVKYTGMTNAGTYAIRCAEDALSRHKASIDAAAVSDLVSKLDFLRSVIQGSEQ